MEPLLPEHLRENTEVPVRPIFTEPPPPPSITPAPQPPAPPIFSAPAIKPPTPKQQSWGTVISIVIIVLMIVIGAFYAWGKRIAEERALTAPPEGVTTY